MGVAGVSIKFFQNMIPSHVLEQFVYVAGLGLLLIWCGIAAKALCDRRVAIRLREELSKLNTDFAQKSVRFDLFTWRYLTKWHQQHAGCECATHTPCCKCFNPASSCLYNLAQYVMVIQEMGPGGYLLGDHAGDSNCDAGSTMSSDSDTRSSSGSMV